jgi:sugar phosphate permease
MSTAKVFGNNASKSSAKKLIILSAILYAITIAGRKIFNANINELISNLGQDKSQLGLISTFFFIGCGVGQLLHGLLCKHYNTKKAIFIVVIITGILYGAVPFIPNEYFYLVKYLWLINGLIEAAIWTSLLLFLNVTIPSKYMPFTFALLALPTPVGNCLAYAISSLFSFLGAYQWSFYSIFILYMITAAVWLLLSGRLEAECLEEKRMLDVKVDEEPDTSKKSGKKRIPAAFIIGLVTICVLCIAEEICYEGLFTWMPTILTERYGMENWIGVLLTMVLPIVAYFGNIFGKFLQEKLKNYMLSMGILFGSAMAVLLITILCFGLNTWVITVIALTICTCMVAGANMIETVIYPMENSQYLNAGLMGGIICASCYVGCAISGYGLGGIADSGSWLPALWLLFFLMLGAALVAFIMYVIERKASKKH